jgi:hypothetical protein
MGPAPTPQPPPPPPPPPSASLERRSVVCLVARGSWQETGEDSGWVDRWNRGALFVVARGDWRGVPILPFSSPLLCSPSCSRERKRKEKLRLRSYNYSLFLFHSLLRKEM